jgi:MFS family permease
VLANRVFRRLILGFAVSYLGDGMSFVAVAWLAIELAPQATAGLWVGGAVAAYTLPGVVGALVFGRRLRLVPARRLLLADHVVRGVFLGAVPLACSPDCLRCRCRAARGLVAAARVGQRGQVHPAGRAAAGRAEARRQHPRQLARLRCHDRRARDRRCAG